MSTTKSTVTSPADTATCNADVEVIERGYAAFGARDVETLRAVLDPSMTWSVPGTSSISGEKKGVDATMAHFGVLVESTGGTFRAELEKCFADGHGHVVAFAHLTAQRQGRSLDVQEAVLFTLRDGRPIEALQTLEDIDAFDALWADAGDQS